MLAGLCIDWAVDYSILSSGLFSSCDVQHFSMARIAEQQVTATVRCIVRRAHGTNNPLPDD